VHQHRTKLIEGFSKRYNVSRLVYYEIADEVYTAIAREKQLKAGSRKKKMELIDALIPPGVICTKRSFSDIREIASLRSQ
jgi:putative endonuclease